MLILLFRWLFCYLLILFNFIIRSQLIKFSYIFMTIWPKLITQNFRWMNITEWNSSIALRTLLAHLFPMSFPLNLLLTFIWLITVPLKHLPIQCTKLLLTICWYWHRLDWVDFWRQVVTLLVLGLELLGWWYFMGRYLIIVRKEVWAQLGSAVVCFC